MTSLTAILLHANEVMRRSLRMQRAGLWRRAIQHEHASILLLGMADPDIDARLQELADADVQLRDMQVNAIHGTLSDEDARWLEDEGRGREFFAGLQGPQAEAYARFVGLLADAEASMDAVAADPSPETVSQRYAAILALDAYHSRALNDALPLADGC